MLTKYNKFLKKYRLYVDLFINNQIIFLCNIDNINLYKTIDIKDKILISKKFLKKNFLKTDISGGLIYFLVKVDNTFDINLFNKYKNFLHINLIFYNNLNYKVKNLKNLEKFNKIYILRVFFFYNFLINFILNVVKLKNIKNLQFFASF